MIVKPMPPTMTFLARRTTISRRRHAVSLVEVLISIAVIAIGLLGVTALIPVAGRQAAEGARNDRMANVGKRAFRQLQQRGLLNPANWIRLETAGPNQGQFTYISTMTYPVPRLAAAPIPPSTSNSYDVPIPMCLDPWGFSRSYGSTPELLARATVLRLPYTGSVQGYGIGNTGLGTAPMFRYTLFGSRTSGGSILPITSTQAEELCVVQDDLTFTLPKTNNQPPTQQLLRGGGVPMKRNATGKFSWMVMLVPEQRRALTVNGRYHGPYEVSVVVFENRDKDIAKRGPNEPDQLVAPVEWVDGWAGGQVTLLPDPVNSSSSLPPHIARPAATIHARAKKGQWILLSGITPSMAIPPADPNHIGGRKADYAWYRIAAIQKGKDPTRPSNAQDRVQLTLQGPDWKLTRPPIGNSVALVYFGNVVAVYKKTMYLDTPN
ncbi:MAG TPA: prepilin-type N-terminal cleavage/methylation domain-containing protein [Pirellulaceae bacterium]